MDFLSIFAPVTTIIKNAIVLFKSLFCQKAGGGKGGNAAVIMSEGEAYGGRGGSGGGKFGPGGNGGNATVVGGKGKAVGGDAGNGQKL